MPRARWLKPEFFRDRKMAELGPVGAVVYQVLWVIADDGGTAPCDPDRLKGEMFFAWSAVGVPEIAEALGHLCTLGRVKFYRAGDELFCQIVNWRKHQQVHKPSAFRYREHYQKQGKDFTEVVPEWCDTGEAPVRESPPPRLPDSKTPRPLESQLHGDASRRAEASQHIGDGDPTFGTLMGLVRTHLYVPDGKASGDWDESRDGSILKALLGHHRSQEVAAAIEGLALLRDFPGVYADAVDWPHWPQPGQKTDLRPLYNNKSGVLAIFTIATQACWKRANSRGEAQRDRSAVHIGDVGALRRAAGTR